jgi:hypothetical protein
MLNTGRRGQKIELRNGGLPHWRRTERKGLRQPAPRVTLSFLLALLLTCCAKAPPPQQAEKSAPGQPSVGGPSPGGGGRRPARAPANVAEPAPTPIDFKAVDQALSQLRVGNVAYNAPPAMFKGESHPISVVLSPAATADQLAQQLHNLLGAQENVQTASIQVSPLMQATLTGQGFNISPSGPQTQAVSGIQPTEWDWTVSPTETGNLDLQLDLEAILDLGNGTSTPRRLKTFTKVIRVRVQALDAMKGFVAGNWQWLWSTLLVPLAGYLWHRRRKTPRRNHSPSSR